MIAYLWRSVNDEGEVLDILVQSRRNKQAALRFMRRFLKSQGEVPDAIVTDKLRSYGAALKVLNPSDRHEMSRRLSNRAEVSHQPTDNKSDRKGGSSHLYPRNDLSPLTLPLTTTSTSIAT
jgi:putative transposase